MHLCGIVTYLFVFPLSSHYSSLLFLQSPCLLETLIIIFSYRLYKILKIYIN
ncbi:hypothetical protein RchiOBHm_Chr7g0211411 [Rosa chinensis]|uniref:Uncharacterized protein n=1 Tax=Rosa chinensis TaxID=74649 RepID=A0A2P6PAG2_ROSCH|nr:hypothetical protein RchiOBHm_Chr7g0211411 [Rosa chinensis]